MKSIIVPIEDVFNQELAAEKEREILRDHITPDERTAKSLSERSPVLRFLKTFFRVG